LAIIGAAFGKIVNSLVADIIMPVLSLAIGHVDLKDRFIVLDGRHFATVDEARKAAAPVLAYGVFLNNIFEFLVIALSIFLVVRQINRLRGPKPA
jgi:large conductance mechanosensitive channel